jgi:hypothetical protein
MGEVIAAAATKKTPWCISGANKRFQPTQNAFYVFERLNL